MLWKAFPNMCHSYELCRNKNCKYFFCDAGEHPAGFGGKNIYKPTFKHYRRTCKNDDKSVKSCYCYNLMSFYLNSV